MLRIEDVTECNGCHACYSACPRGCISMEYDSEGFLYPRVKHADCISCGQCERVCPIVQPLRNDRSILDAYAAYNKNAGVRNASSSGGVFSLLSESIIRCGGAVFGAAMSGDCKTVSHIMVDDISDLDRLRGSKYVQSAIGEAYKQAKQLLDGGRKVLFSGTPCQIGGLRAYLGKEYDDLYTQDVVCHGVPSPMVWRKYVEYRESVASSKAREVSFRRKSTGWKEYSISMGFMNDTEYVQPHKNDLYSRGYLANLYLRPSCHACRYKSLDRQGDITLADLWGVEKLIPEFSDDKGTSLVLLNTEKGRDLFAQLESQLVLRKVDANSAVRYNSAAISSVAQHKKRAYFFKKLPNAKLEPLIEKCLRRTLLSRAKSKISRSRAKLRRVRTHGR